MMRKLLPFVAFVVYTLILFRPLFLQGKVPMPADALVSGYFPWNASGWEGAQYGIPRAEIIATDVFRQQLPWIDLTVAELRQGRLPLWNPYNFTGMPLMANLQSHVWFPWTLAFVLLPLTTAWTAFVVSVPIVGMIGMYLWLRTRALSKIASVFGGIAFSSMSFIVLWLPWGFIPYGAVLLPWILWASERVLSRKPYGATILSIFLTLELLSGYMQIVIYTLLFVLAYILWRLWPRLTWPWQVPWKERWGFLVKVSCCGVVALLLSAVQLVPSFEAYLLSAREVSASTALFYDYLLPPKHLITAIAPHFFGNPQTFNFWGEQHQEYMSYIGIVALILAVYRLMSAFRESTVRFFGAAALLALLFAMVEPVASLLVALKIPILSSGIPSRTLFLVQTSMIVLAAEGLDGLKAVRRTPLYGTVVTVSLAYFLVALGAYLLQMRGRLIAADLALGLSSLRLPSLIFLLAGGLLVTTLYKPRFRYAVGVLLVVLGIFEYARFFGQNVAFSQKEHVYPPHPVIEWLQARPGHYRHWGYDEARFDHNFATYYRLFSAEGFDSLYPKRYGELLASARNGRVPAEILRSDAVIPWEDTKGRRRLFDLLSIRYVLARTDRGDTSLAVKYKSLGRQPLAQFGNALVYENESALPRTYLVAQFRVVPDQEASIKTLFGEDFDPKREIVLAKRPSIAVDSGSASGSASILRYEPGVVEIKANAPGPSLLVLNDQYYPGWKAYVDEMEQEILRANEVFRAVALSAGQHAVVFRYDPPSVRIGLAVSMVGIVLLAGVALADRRHV